MKDYNQMAQDVFRRRDEYIAARKKKTAMLLKAGVPLCSLVLVVILAVTLWPNNLPEIPTVPVVPTSPTATATQSVTAESEVAQVDHTKPVASAQDQDPTEPQTMETVPFVPVDPVEKPTIKPTTSTKPNYSVDATSATVGVAGDAVPPCSPEQPEYTMPSATEGLVPEWTLPTVTDAPSTEAPTALPQDRPPYNTDETEPALPMETEPATGPLEITVGGKKYVAQTGDMVSYTAELYVKDLFETFAAAVVHSNSLEVVEVVDPTEEDASPVHYPNLTGGSEMLNYHYNGYHTQGDRKIFVSGVKLFGYNFKEQKVLFTFDFMVTKPGKAEVALEIHDLCKKGDGTPYFANREQYIFEGIGIEEYMTVTPADEVVIPTAPKVEEETVPPFTYPEESYDGDLLINCDGRTYAADLGQRITYIVELEAEKKFEDADLIATYTKELDLLVPEDTADKPKEDFILPNLLGSFVGYNTEYTVDNQALPAVKVSASRISKYDFRRRKVLLQLDFIVTKPGEAQLDLFINEMTIKTGKVNWQKPSVNNDEAYFYRGEQLIFDGIEIYEYVIVH